MLVLTIVILILLSLVSYILFDRDILAPATVVSLGFLFSALCAFYNEERWGLEFSSQTTWLIFVGVGMFIVGGIIAVLISNVFKGKLYGFSHEISSVQPIAINQSKTIVIILFQLVLLVLLFIHVRHLTGYSNWILAIAKYRLITGRLADPNDISIRLPFITRNMVEVGFAIGSVYAYIVGNNLVSHKKQPLLNWVPIVLCAIATFMQGDRSNMIRLWLTILITAYVLRKRDIGWKTNKETTKMIKKMALSLIVVGALFVALRELVGRETDMGPLYYLTFYAGCPTAALDQFLKHPIASSPIWGKETFFYTNQSLHVLVGHPERYNFYKEFIKSPNGTYIGNVYTAIRPPYYDFGFIGLVLVMFIMGAFFTFLYCRVRKRYGKSPIDFRLLLYCYIAYTFFMYFYNCYNAFLSHTLIKFCVELLFIRWFLIGFSLKSRYSIKLGRNKDINLSNV